ncbi:uncharacterized protein LOC116618104 [Nematostella vectensis]|uniref:uncharacterized protein LOC116618104 n=1 Tax=Nematostella vectensis TaxID=45351 RepID=UPI002077738A|nr:uncharacterized protein LOC116618104 [Nematostella vectensis]
MMTSKRVTAVLGCLVFVSWVLTIVQAGEHTVVAVVVKDKNDPPGAPVLNIGGKKVKAIKLEVPAHQTNAAYPKASQTNAVYPEASQQDQAPAQHVAKPVSDGLPVVEVKPQKTMHFKLVKLSDEDIKKIEDEKKKKLEDKKLEKKLYPCEDYSPFCHHYTATFMPSAMSAEGRAPQCRDFYMQKNCRETCNLCHIPLGVYLGGQDTDHCAHLAKNQCVHDWVKETCKNKCGGNAYSRVGVSNIFVGKKKSIVHKLTKETRPKSASKEAPQIKLQSEQQKEENAIPKRAKPEPKGEDAEVSGSDDSGSADDNKIGSGSGAEDEEDEPEEDEEDDEETKEAKPIIQTPSKKETTSKLAEPVTNPVKSVAKATATKVAKVVKKKADLVVKKLKAVAEKLKEALKKADPVAEKPKPVVAKAVAKNVAKAAKDVAKKADHAVRAQPAVNKVVKATKAKKN